MSSPSPSPNNATTMSDPLKTPAAKKKEDYEDYNLSPPKVPAKRRTFDEAVRAIKYDFNELRVEWEESEEKRKVVWFKKRDDGTEVELPPDFCRILLFLYSRNFKKDVGKDNRRVAVINMHRHPRLVFAIVVSFWCTYTKMNS
jgi:hypothetical protein